MQILAIANQKGGTAKTTTAAALLQAAAGDGRRVLAVDLDPQANLTFALGGDARRAGSYELLSGTVSVEQAVQETPQGIALIAGNRNLIAAGTSQGSAGRLRRALAGIQSRYDIAAIDTPPTAGELLFNALNAGTKLLIPLCADTFCLQGLYQMIGTTRQFRAVNPELQIAGFILTRFDGRSTLARNMRDTITQKAAEQGIPCLGVIREGVSVREAAALQVSLFEYAAGSKPAQDYLAVYRAVCNA